MIDPRFQEMDSSLEASMLAQSSGNEQGVLEHLWNLRTTLDLVYFDILAQRWARRPQRAKPILARTSPTTDDLLV